MRRIIPILLCAAIAIALMPISSSAMDRQYMKPSGNHINGHDYNIWDEYRIEDNFNLAIGGTYEIPSYSRTYEYAKYVVKTVSGAENKVVSIDGKQITGKSAGMVRIYFYDSSGKILKDSTMDKDYVAVTVRKINLISTSKTTYISSGSRSGGQVAFALKQNITERKSQIKGLSRSDGYDPVQKIDFAENKLYVTAHKAGKTRIKVNVEGKVLEFYLNVKSVKVNTQNLIAYKGKTGDKISFSSEKPSDVVFSSSAKSVATVGSSSGKITYKGLGRCCIYTKLHGNTIGKTLVEVTYKNQYLAVQNAFEDMNTKIVYSQGKRMGRYYRDCSSFTSRCYYDSSLGRNIYTIGPKSARSWSLTAAGQAKWLYDRGKTVAWSRVSEKKLLPGDLVFYRTDYAGVNPEWKHIDHVGMYVGNGMVMDTIKSRSIGAGAGAIDMRYYADDNRVVYIGRPMK